MQNFFDLIPLGGVVTQVQDLQPGAALGEAQAVLLVESLVDVVPHRMLMVASWVGLAEVRMVVQHRLLLLPQGS